MLKSPSYLDVDLESKKDKIKADIRKELKIKEGAENMAKVAKDAKQRRNVSAVLKTCQAKITKLQEELERLNAAVADSVGKLIRICMVFLFFFFFLFFSGWRRVVWRAASWPHIILCLSCILVVMASRSSLLT